MVKSVWRGHDFFSTCVLFDLLRSILSVKQQGRQREESRDVSRERA
jgi:hypothetical protein